MNQDEVNKGLGALVWHLIEQEQWRGSGRAWDIGTTDVNGELVSVLFWYLPPRTWCVVSYNDDRLELHNGMRPVQRVGVATCCPGDVWSDEVGARLALKRALSVYSFPHGQGPAVGRVEDRVLYHNARVALKKHFDGLREV